MARKETPPVEYSFSCENCPVHKKFGAAKLTMESAAIKHWQRFYDHVVRIKKTEILYTLSREGSAVHQLGEDEAPF